ncbi:MAG: helix-turn-helix transcriptional regulator [Halohasta sp.]
MDRVLDEIEFLALSANRVDVLVRLADGPHTRQELGTATGASQPTLGRILRDFEERKWITTTEGGYEATATGRLVADGIEELSGIVETELKLREFVEWLPTEELPFDLRHFRTATVTVPTRTRPAAPVGRVIDLVEAADSVTVLSHAFNDRMLEAVTDWVAAGGRFEGVFSAAAIEPVTDDDALAERLRTLVDAETATIRIHEGRVPLAVTLTDDLVSLLLRDDDGRLQASIDTDDETVAAWARECYEGYRAASRPLDPETLASDH